MTSAATIVTPRPAVLRPANQQALQLTGRPYLSFSQIYLMRACPRKFSLHYVEHASPAFTPASLIFGSAVHAAVETHFRAMLAGVTLDAGELHQAFRVARKGQKAVSEDLPIRYAVGQDEVILDDMAKRMIDSFLASPAAQPAGTLLGIEEEFLVTIDPTLPDIMARVDLVYESTGAIMVRDFKTSRSKWNAEKAVESADQILLYGRMLRDLSRGMDKPMRGEFVVLTKAKAPVVQVLDVPVTAEGIRRTQESIATTWQAVLAANFYPSPSPMNCSTCQYKSHCPVFGGA